jgi:hypothetical protein
MLAGAVFVEFFLDGMVWVKIVEEQFRLPVIGFSNW